MVNALVAAGDRKRSSSAWGKSDGEVESQNDRNDCCALYPAFGIHRCGGTYQSMFAPRAGVKTHSQLKTARRAIYAFLSA